jgi:hypothetical protein
MRKKKYVKVGTEQLSEFLKSHRLRKQASKSHWDNFRKKLKEESSNAI